MNSIARMLGGALLAALMFYVGLCSLLFFTQRSQMYFPTNGRASTPTIVLQREDVNLLVSTRTQEGDRAVVYFGGNAEDVSRTVPELGSVFPESSIYALHYRGYGGSEGSPSEAALIEDGLALLDQVHTRHPHITVIGRSLGSGVAVQIAARRPSKRLVLVTPFDSMVAVAADHFPLFPVRLLLRDRYESNQFAAQIQVPVTLIVAGNDRIVPPARALNLAKAFSSTQPEVVMLEQAGHNDIDAFPGYPTALRGR